jgi:hypothetical protein
VKSEQVKEGWANLAGSSNEGDGKKKTVLPTTTRNF